MQDLDCGKLKVQWAPWRGFGSWAGASALWRGLRLPGGASALCWGCGSLAGASALELACGRRQSARGPKRVCQKGARLRPDIPSELGIVGSSVSGLCSAPRGPEPPRAAHGRGHPEPPRVLRDWPGAPRAPENSAPSRPQERARAREPDRPNGIYTVGSPKVAYFRRPHGIYTVGPVWLSGSGALLGPARCRVRGRSGRSWPVAQGSGWPRPWAARGGSWLLSDCHA